MEALTVVSEQQIFLKTEIPLPYLKFTTAGTARLVELDWHRIRIQCNFLLLVLTITTQSLLMRPFNHESSVLNHIHK